MSSSLKLYSYFRSSAAYRVRIALNYKGLPYETIPINLVKGEHKTPEYKKIHPAMLLPALVTTDGNVITQSLVIIDYLDRTFPDSPKLIPENCVDRAAALSIAMIIACDTHPLQNLSVFQYASKVAGRDVRDQWVTHFIERGLSTVEESIRGDGPYCIGGEMSIADVCLVPQVYNALRFQVPLEEKFPNISR
ncbi:glutathione-S-transferase theta, GST, putative, partial [Perkinsus marinus ATCC 50983]